MIIEVESRFMVKNMQALNKFIESDLEFIEEKTERDVYYDTPAGDWFKKGVFIRLRNHTVIDFKFNIKDFLSKNKYGSHTHCSEFSFSYPLKKKDWQGFMQVLNILGIHEPPNNSFEEFLEVNALSESIVIEKKRKIFFKDDMTICVDEVERLGTFLELEILVNDETQIDAARSRIANILPKHLDVKPLTTGYVALFWKIKDFNVYKGGKYHTIEDRQLFQEEQKVANR